jgi:hypothetical protein
MKTAHRLICHAGERPVILTEEVSVVQSLGEWVSYDVNGIQHLDSKDNFFETKKEAVAAGIDRITDGLRAIHQRYEKTVEDSLKSVLNA